MQVPFVCSQNRLRKRIICLHIPDEYEYMDELPVDRLRGGVEPHIDFECV